MISCNNAKVKSSNDSRSYKQVIFCENSQKQATDIHPSPNPNHYHIKLSYASPTMILWSKFAR